VRTRAFTIALLLWIPAGLALAASITVTGTNGTPGSAGADSATAAGDGGPGGAGADATAVADSPDASNDAHAFSGTGGPGGTGGNGISGGVPGAGGLGGTGGNANATAVTTLVTGAADAFAQAGGGLGGAGGAGGTSSAHPPGAAGPAGASGMVEAHSSATSGDSATANSDATQGAQDTLATAQAHAGSGDAVAGAAGYGGNQFGASNLGTTPGNGTADADAFSHSGNALAAATGIGGAGHDVSHRGGSGTAQAHAVSDTGDATATTNSHAGDAFPRLFGLRPSDPVAPGGPGADASAIEAVSGSAAGLLTLTQATFATDSQQFTGGGGGNATSVLHASNPGGGRLLAQVSSRAGFGGGDANALVVATVGNASRVEANANAMAGGDGPSACFAGSCEVIYGAGGDGNASATAIGQGEALASSAASGINAPTLHVDAAAETVGAVQRTSATLDRTGPLDLRQDFARIPPKSLSAIAGVATSAALPGAVGNGAEARMFGAPSATDLATWTSGNPNAQAALATGQALALGSVSAATTSFLAPSASFQFTGGLELDLTRTAVAPGRHLELAFLDPTAAAASFDALHLTLTRDGSAILFERQYTTSASAVTDLDDHVFDLGELAGAGDVTHLVLSFSGELPTEGDTPLVTSSVFSFTYAVLAPEPGVTGLALLGAAAGLAFRRRAARPPA